MKTIGIIGGLGPETTSEFYLDISSTCYKKNKKNRPHIIISSVPLPYQIEKDIILYNKDPGRMIPFLVTEAKRLEKSGADFIVLPCNSLHIFIKEIRTAVKIPVLSIVEETIKFLKKNKLKRVGIVSTTATIKNKLYENAFKKNNITYEIPDDFQQNEIGKIIIQLLTGQQKNKDKQELTNIIDDFKNKKVDCVLLACTDLQLLNPKHPYLKIYDTMKILSQATVEKCLK